MTFNERCTDMKHKTVLRILAAALILTTALCLSGCVGHQEPTEPDYETFTNPTWAPVSVEEISAIVTEDNIANLDKYPGLKKVDLSGSTCYAAIAEYIATHPEVEVTYTVSLGGVSVSTTSTDLILLPGTYDYDTLTENLAYLPAVTNLFLQKSQLSPDQVTALREAYPEIAITYSIEFNGVEYDANTTELNLSDYDTSKLDVALEKLSMMPSITKVELMKEDGTSNFSVDQLKQLQAAAPHIAFNYNVTLFGKTVSTADDIVDFSKCDVDSEEELRNAMALLTGASKVRVVGADLSHETLAAIQADYPNTKLVWRVYVAGTPFLTDEETLFMSQMKLRDSNVENLKYLTSAKYVDAGHSEKLTDISWLAYMPDVEILILSGSPITDLSPLAGCTKLEWLEVVFCGQLKDISPVKNLTNLRFLNIGMTKVSDISAVQDLPLERFHALDTKVPHADFEAYKASHPDCWTTYRDQQQPYGKGWRYDDNGKTYFEYYAKMREIFDYASRI